MIHHSNHTFWLRSATIALVVGLLGSTALAAPLPGGTLDPTAIPKYVTPLVIPPPMPASPAATGVYNDAAAFGGTTNPSADYNIAVRQFQQQILPGGVWNSVNGRNDPYNPTKIWSYGRAEDTLPANFTAPVPLAAGVSFNYPAFTVEAASGTANSVRWINDLVADPSACSISQDRANDPACNFLPHLFRVDQTLHWANPAGTDCAMGDPNRVNCATLNPAPYTGPVPIVTHVHGAHVNATSDGYPEAWWLPGANNIGSYVSQGTLFDQVDPNNSVPGSAFYNYENDQPAATIWYHDHSLGITRLNVMAGPAGFWLLRGGVYDGATDGVTLQPAVLPGPAPVDGAGDPNFNPAYRATLRDIPIVIQDRSFNDDGSLFYPDSREFFDGYAGPYTGDPSQGSDIAPAWNPEAFFNTMVVNGTTWPEMEVAPALYRFRLLNGCNSRFLNLAMFEVILPTPPGVPGNDNATLGREFPFHQIGGDQGFLPRVTVIQTGLSRKLGGKGVYPRTLNPGPNPDQALLMSPAERADVIVDFRGLPGGTVIRMINTGPDSPFGGFPVDPLDLADATTSGQIMQFRVNTDLLQASDSLTTPPENLVLNYEPNRLPAATKTRNLTLNEESSQQVCVSVAPDGAFTVLATATAPDPGFLDSCTALGGEPMGPKEALLGVGRIKNGALISRAQEWMAPITENPALGATENWVIYNLTMDAHPIHLHLVRFRVMKRGALDPVTFLKDPLVPARDEEYYEEGYKDTLIVYPGEYATVRATFDKEGLYVWHCHILEHEDNEMMRPYYVGNIANSPVQ